MIPRVSELVPTRPGQDVDVQGDLQQFEEMLLDQLAAAGLPTDGVLVALDEREQALTSFSGALRRLPAPERARSFYVSKMIAAAAAGLFDAALSYLWNETVGELRRRVVGYDLAYFFEIAVPSPDRRKHLSTEEDLAKVDDIDLLRAALQIGLLSPAGHAQLDHIRYMRNHASAAHLNQVEISGLVLAGWLDICIRQVITLPYDTITAETKRLLANIKDKRLDSSEVPRATAFFDDLPQERADALGAGLFGLYVDPTRTAIVTDNVLLLWPDLWPYISEDARQQFGVKFGRYTASLDTTQAKAARELLDLVDGTSYLPEKEWAVEVDAAIEALLAAHTGFNNFYTEPAPARALAGLVTGRRGMPSGTETKYLHALVDLYLGNDYGLSWAADPIYQELLEALGPAQAGRVLRSFLDPLISAKLWKSVARKQWAKLLDILEPKLTSPADRALIKAIREFSGTPDQLRETSSIQRLAMPRRPRETVTRRAR